MSLSWIETLIAVNEEIVACERRFHRQCILVVELSMGGQVTVEDEMQLASLMTNLFMLRTHRNSILADATIDA